ncbi:WD40/YVTN/BNR-like repeat-containing protein [Chelativorans intermedius]|uniref:WD40/YVTN/BNR-like repeat-containing protein n=1 Tax=Chelativorans intermedius TaxID=515947 RepID=A0ABV6DC42_9HYPH|nr:exo-alpha-sialidase [Chelativorans intermedius]MCT9000339.1 exo-alpha-sialidase [Chelativorans intermedius]
MKRRMYPAIIAVTLAVAIAGGTVGWLSQASERISLAEVSHIHGIAVDPADPQRLYLATHYGVWHTTPDGMAERISDNSNDYMGFSPHPSEADVFFASGHPANGGNMGVIVSRDGARNWQQLASGVDGPVDFHAMDVSPADPNVIYGLYREVQVSRDGGKSWEVVGSPPADVFDLAASGVKPDMVYAATRSGLMVSVDGGMTWKTTGTEGRPASMVETAPDGSVYAFVLGSGLMKAPAQALAWQPVANVFGEQILLHLAVDPSDPNRMFAVTDKSTILTSTDGGKNWAALSS